MQKWFVFAVSAIMLTGCEQEQTQSISTCAVSNAESVDGGPENPDNSQDGNDTTNLVGDGGPCNLNDDCESAACLPSTNSFSYGYCYGPTMTGCIVITDPSPVISACPEPLKRIYVCGDFDVVMLGVCAEIGTGQFGEKYHCCDKL